MEAPKFCPHCGTDWVRDDEYLERDGFEFTTPLAEVRYLGRVINLTPQEYLLLFTLAKAGERWVSHESMVGRIALSDEVRTDLVSVVICKVRKKLGDASPIQTSYNKPRQGCGVKWATPGSTETMMRRASGSDLGRPNLGGRPRKTPQLEAPPVALPKPEPIEAISVDTKPEPPLAPARRGSRLSRDRRTRVVSSFRARRGKA